MDKTNNNIERRYIPAGALRAMTEDGKTTVMGQAAVFDELSEDLGGFRERIEPGFFVDVLGDDVRALWNHNADMPLARSANGTLRIAESKSGLDVDFEPSNTSWGRDALAAIERGDVNQMSFAFTVREGGDQWDVLDGQMVRTLLKGGCSGLYDVSPVTYPAYPQTSAGTRARYEEARALLQPDPEEERPDAQEGDGEPNAETERARARLSVQRKKIDLLEKE